MTDKQWVYAEALVVIGLALGLILAVHHMAQGQVVIYPKTVTVLQPEDSVVDVKEELETPQCTPAKGSTKTGVLTVERTTVQVWRSGRVQRIGGGVQVVGPCDVAMPTPARVKEDGE